MTFHTGNPTFGLSKERVAEGKKGVGRKYALSGLLLLSEVRALPRERNEYDFCHGVSSLILTYET
jgi:hypothetical protein